MLVLEISMLSGLDVFIANRQACFFKTDRHDFFQNLDFSCFINGGPRMVD